ncbi:hypothetical protein ATCC90586_011992 [Pythium insidiosum]|nr:hypothetical protein ATCC90586_011992 [Pythium insidiosum]
MTIRNQRAFQFHHSAGVSWDIPAPWGDASHCADRLDQRYTGTPGPDFYTVNFPPELLREFERRTKVIKDVGQLTNVPRSVRQDQFNLDDFRALLFGPLQVSTTSSVPPAA